jgi:hypothetical protein
MASEKLLEADLRKEVRQAKGEAIKFLPSLIGLPDRIVKTTGKKPQPLQLWWKKRLEALGFEWRLIDDEVSLTNFINEINGL